jgi:hypothetical protein
MMLASQGPSDFQNPAVWYAEHGFPVFPCKPRGKEPLTGHGFKDATTDQKLIAAWWQKWPCANIAIPTGAASGLLGVDIDPRNGGDKSLHELEAEHGPLPDTAKQNTGGGGLHIIFRHPGGPVPKALAPGIDLKGEGGYIVVPPSIHPSGKLYQWDGTEGRNALLNPAELPGWLRERIATTSNGGTCSKLVPETAEKWIPGNRNNLLTSLAGKMRRWGLSPEAIEAALLVENNRHCPSLPDGEVRSIARSVGRYQPSSNKAQRHPEIVRLSEVEARAVSWLWGPYLAFGALSMLSGDPGAGKTFLSLAIACAVTVGHVPYSSEPCAPLHVMYLSHENNPEHVVRPRFDSLGGDPDRFHLLRGSISGAGERADRGSIWLSDVSLLGEALQQTRARLVIVDPIQSYLGAKVDAHRSNETRPVLDGLSRLAEEHDCCILLVRHLSKAPTGRAIHRGLGSIDLTGAVRTELMAGTAADGSERRAMVQIKNNLGPFGKALGYAIEADGSFQWTGESELTPAAFVAAESSDEEKGARQEAEDFLRDILSEGPRPQKQIGEEAMQAGIADRTLRRAKKRLKLVARKRGMAGGWEWGFPEGGQT